MIKPPIPENENERLEALYRYKILDTPPEEIFDDVTKLAAHICDTPYALVSFIDDRRQWFKSKVGVEESEVAREIAFCAHTIASRDDAVIIENAECDERFSANPLVVSNPSIRFYAGVKLITTDGFAIGTLCVFDCKTRTLTHEQVEALKTLRRQTMTALELRHEHARLNRLLGEYEQQAKALLKAEQEYRNLVDSAQDLIYRADNKGVINYSNDVMSHLLGYSKDELKNRHFTDFIKPEFRDNVRSLYELQLQNKTPNTYFEVPVINKTGELIWIGQNVRTIFVDGTVSGFQAVARNITERKQWEELREKLIVELEKALYNAKTLSGLLPICASCKKIRDDQGYWNQVEAYIIEHSDATFTHGICPDCMQKLYSNYVSKS